MADRILLLTVLMLLGLGSVVVFSSSTAVSEEYFGASTKLILSHLVKVVLGLGLLFVMARIDYRMIRGLCLPLVVASTVLLALTLVPNSPWAVTTKGATRWLDLGFMVVQPAELAKLALVVHIASILASGEGRVREYRRGFVPVLTVLGVFVVCLVQQPNFGNALTLTLVAAVMLFLGGARIRHLFGSGLATMPMLVFVAIQRPHVIRRFEGFLDPGSDPLGAGFQLRQSLVALGSGGFFGVGPGAGRQSGFFLPDSHTDFVFAVVGEEFGLLGTLLVVALFGLLLWRGTVIACRATDPFGRYLAIGVTAMIGVVAFLNMAVAVGLAPTAGLPLPFVSYGGSAMMVNLGGVGILLSIASRAGLGRRRVLA
ncbi:MAG: putative lipid II flippase FtsW [bacterium]